MPRDNMPRPTEKSLVLVIGAGASNEVGLPLGSELKKQIGKALDIRYERGINRESGDEIIDGSFRVLASEDHQNRHNNINLYLEAAWRIRDAMPQAISIDNFIDSHRSNDTIALCGKLAIARCILDAECKSKLKVDRDNINNKIDFPAVENTWFNSFFQLLTENCQQNDLPERLSKVGIICFNYDRCIEHYLHSSLQNFYGMSADDASSLLSNLEIHHPYGTTGKLPWQDIREGFQYGAAPNPRKLIMLANGLRTFTEGIDKSNSDIVATRSLLCSTKRIVFLGFAFHRLNLQLLFPGLQSGEQARATKIYATALGISPSDVKEIMNDLSSHGGGSAWIHACKIRS